jgi:hypothetical protein
MSLEESVQLAQACSAQNATGLGSQAGVRDFAGTLDFIRTTALRTPKDCLVTGAR